MNRFASLIIVQGLVQSNGCQGLRVDHRRGEDQEASYQTCRTVAQELRRQGQQDLETSLVIQCLVIVPLFHFQHGENVGRVGSAQVTSITDIGHNSNQHVFLLVERTRVQ